MYEGPPVAREDILAIYVIINESLGMSVGKLAAQVFQAALMAQERHSDSEAWLAWRAQGSRTLVATRLAWI
jgi:peptidyl-tRNA hydrolase